MDAQPQWKNITPLPRLSHTHPIFSLNRVFLSLNQATNIQKTHILERGK